MDNPKTQIVDSLQKANNVLVTVSNDPSVDQLAAAIGFTLFLNKLGKHATAVYSGSTPSTIEFLQPEKTLEKNTDSLRDFIIALDKSKADKLRYKVEDQMVKIFITPYRTSITDKDLEFSQGDFNVDVVLALGVQEQKDLDQAITNHGRILHDATVVSIGTQLGAGLGSINWVEPGSSSLSEMLLEVGLELKDDVLDGQMATAFLTGIVSETDRFSNEKTSSNTMQMSAKLMAAGANQQLVATQLQSPDQDNGELPVPVDNDQPDGDQSDSGTSAPVPAPRNDGSLHIEHETAGEQADMPVSKSALPEPQEQPELTQVQIDEDGQFRPAPEVQAAETPEPETTETVTPSVTDGPRIILDPPSLGGTLTASGATTTEPSATDVLGIPSAESNAPLLSHSNIAAPAESTDTLTALEEQVNSPHVAENETQPSASEEVSGIAEEPVAVPDASVDAARDAVSEAVAGASPQVLEPVQALNAQPMDLNLEDLQPASPSPVQTSYDQTPPPAPVPPEQLNPEQPTSVAMPAPPPVPPPLMPPSDPGQSAL